MTYVDPLMTVPAILRDRAARFGSKVAIVGEAADGSIDAVTYAELERRSRAIAKSLIAAGIEHGDRVAIWAPNVWEWATTCFGVQSAGAVVVPVNTRYKGREAAYIIRKSGARALFAVNGFLGIDYPALLAEVDADDAVDASVLKVVVRGDAPDGWQRFDEFLASGTAVTDEHAHARATAVTADDLCDISFTSGTTGFPKGVMSTYFQQTNGFGRWADDVGLAHDDKVLAIAPFFHSFGSKATMFTSLLAGATIYPQVTFDPAACLGLIDRERISVVPGPPAIFQDLLVHREAIGADLSSLRLAVTGSASVPVELVVRMRADLGIDRVVTGYGLTESSGIATMCRYDDDPETIARSAGRPLPGVELMIQAADGSAAPTGEHGEVLIRGYNVMQGYWDDPERTKEAVVDGWLHTGDIGVLDGRGYLTITDRAKDMYIVGGFNVYPAEVENVLARHPDVAQAAVVGVDDERLGEAGFAFVRLRPGGSITEPELLTWARAQMANFKVPRFAEFVDSLPTNASAKVLKPALRERAVASVAARATAASAP